MFVGDVILCLCFILVFLPAYVLDLAAEKRQLLRAEEVWSEMVEVNASY